ncbi:MAG: hypothetical protein R2705_07960 [Ilumatobacteraceae bacterium]
MRHRVDARQTDAGWNKLAATAPGHVREARRLVVDALSPEQLAALGGRAARAGRDRSLRRTGHLRRTT